MMKKGIGLLVTAVAMLFTIQPCSTIMAGTQQQNSMKTEKSAKPRKKVVKQDGWRVPGVDEYTTVSRVKERQVNGVAVTQKVFETKARPVVDLEGNTVDNVDQKGINVTHQIAKKKKQLFDVRDFSTYEVNGRVFANGVTLVPVAIEEHVRVYLGAMYSLFYYDEDGDGRFEARYSGLPLPRTPEWVGTARNSRSHQ
jgi:hypothetical protein